MGTIFTIVCAGLVLVLAEITASCLVRIVIARFSRSNSVAVPDYGLLLPEISGAATLAVLALLGVRSLLTVLGGGILFALAALPIAVSVWRAAGQGEAHTELRRVAAVLGGLFRLALHLPAADLRALTGLLRGRGPGDPAPVLAPRAAVVPDRAVPSLRNDPLIGTPPAAPQVAADLEASGAMVPDAWARVADLIAGSEPEDEDELIEFMEEQAAGILTAADAWEAHAENLAVIGVDPAYLAGLFDLTDEFADMASLVAQIHRRYHEIYQLIHEHRDSGGTLPNKPGWFGDNAQQGGQAA